MMIPSSLYDLLIQLTFLLDQWSDASVTSYGGEVDCLLDIVVEEKRCHTIGVFREHYTTVAYKWSRRF